MAASRARDVHRRRGSACAPASWRWRGASHADGTSWTPRQRRRPFRQKSGESSIAEYPRRNLRRASAPEGQGAADDPTGYGTIRRDRSRAGGRSRGEDGSIRPAFTAGLAPTPASRCRLRRAETRLPSPPSPPPFAFRASILLVLLSSVIEPERHGQRPVEAARCRDGLTTGGMA
jgi:hypothetical protein